VVEHRGACSDALTKYRFKTLREPMSAGQKWLQLGLDILSYEFGHSNDGQLLSEGADRLVERHPFWGRIVIVLAGEIIIFHLANLLDDKYDFMSMNFWRHILRRTQ